MNIRKQVDYSAMFTALDKLMASDLPQMELYCEIGRLVSSRPEKGAAVAASEYLSSIYPDVSGFSPRNLRRMREFYRTYEDTPEVLAEAMTIGWTQNVVILEAELTFSEKIWYVQAVRQFGWSKLVLLEKIKADAHKKDILDMKADPCYSEDNSGDKNGVQESSGTLLQSLWASEIQRGLQRERTCGPYLQRLFSIFSSTAGRADDTPTLRNSAAALSQQKQDDVAEKSNARSSARSEAPGLSGFHGKISPYCPESEKTRGRTATIGNPSWCIHVKYFNDMAQNNTFANAIPDRMADLQPVLMKTFEYENYSRLSN